MEVSANPRRLIDADGNVRFGIFPAPVDEVNHRDFALTDPFGRRRGRLVRHYYSPAKAIRTLGMPQTPIRVAIERAVDWFRAHRMLPS